MGFDDLDDAALLVATARGEDLAFAVFYRRWLPIVTGFFLRRVGQPEVAFISPLRRSRRSWRVWVASILRVALPRHGILGSQGVTAVTLVLNDGSQVQATTENGLFAAWWPGTGTVQSAVITTTSGTTTQVLTARTVAPTGSTGASSFGASGSSGATGATGSTQAPPPNAADALVTRFAVLRQPQPYEVPLPSDIAGQFEGPAQPPNPYGLNPVLARYARAANTWVLPGTAGVCLITTGIVGPSVGSSGCGSTTTALSGNLIVFSYKWPTHEIALVGLAPDGNTTVSVTDTDGSVHQVPVTDNVYVVIGGSPSTITLHAATGTPTNIGIP